MAYKVQMEGTQHGLKPIFLAMDFISSCGRLNRPSSYSTSMRISAGKKMWIGE
jgi:hypothetical protein